MSYQFSKHFTREEADALIPHIRDLFREVTTLLTPDHNNDEADATTPDHHTAYARYALTDDAYSDKATPPSPYRHWPREKRREAAYRLLNALQVKGIVIQDVERGLIDFPAIIAGKEIFLCYELSDGKAISWYHELHAGYAGRKKLPDPR